MRSDPVLHLPAGVDPSHPGDTRERRRGDLVLAVANAISFVFTGLFVTHWGVVPTIMGALCLLAFVLGVCAVIRRGPRR